MTVIVRICRLLVSLLLLLHPSTAILDFETDFGAVSEDDSPETCAHNTRLLNDVFRRNLAQHETLRIVNWNRTIYFYPGIVAKQLYNVHLLVDGVMRFSRPENTSDVSTDTASERPSACWLLTESENVTISTTVSLNETPINRHRGLLDGQGSQYWGVPFVGYLQLHDQRPPLLHIKRSSHVLVQRMALQDCPMECLIIDQADHVLVRNASIVSRRTTRHTHGFVDLSAFGTKGITISGSSHVDVASVDIWTQDECIRINDGSENIKLQGLNASGLGVAIASSGGRLGNIMLQNSRLYRCIRGIYLSFYPSAADSIDGGAIENVHVENLTMETTAQWPLWFGPAQMASPEDACQANPCSLCWPQTFGSSCNVLPKTTMRNVTLRDVQINNPRLANGVLLSGGESSVIDSVLFDNVRVTKGEQLLYATKDLTRTFPGLNLPVRDSYVSKSDRKLMGDPHAALFHIEPSERLDDYHGYELPSQEFLGMNIVARIGIIVGTCLCALSLVILLALCVRQNCRKGEDYSDEDDDDSVLRPAEQSMHDQDDTLSVEHSDRVRSKGDELRGDDYHSPFIPSTLHEYNLEDPLLPQNTDPPPMRRQRSTRITRSCHVAPYHVMALLAAVYGLLVGLSWLVKLPGKPDWERLNQYYMCEGVTNGVAKGSTWPVPYCFANETERFSLTQVYDHLTAFLRSHFVLAACLLTCFSLYVHFSFLFKDRTAHNALASIGGIVVESERPVSSLNEAERISRESPTWHT